MSKPCWNDSARQKLQSLSKPDRPPRVAIMGIGSEVRGDDAAGVMVACELAAHRDAPPTVCIVEAGAAPENFTGRLRRFDPDLVLLIDAAQMNEPIGAVRWIDWRDTSGLSASTHTLPLHVLAEFLVNELDCEVALIGIQPRDTAIAVSLSPGVQRAVDEVARELQAMLSLNELTLTGSLPR